MEEQIIFKTTEGIVLKLSDNQLVTSDKEAILEAISKDLKSDVFVDRFAAQQFLTIIEMLGGIKEVK